DQNNLSTALAAIDVGSDIESEIASAVNAGKVATVHEKPVAFGNGTNVGYLLIDSETGAGAYKISSGTNGGFCETVYSILLAGLSITSDTSETGGYLITALKALIDGIDQGL
ncbi:hypothetical protein, partial [Gynuella sp.]|uniref:hypothetical protein n=1 Tax=Gynuella sp. TaxID=2969146 RepID=UPI003D152E0E